MTEQRTPARARRKRPHPAQGARVAAAGVGFASMFGIVAGLGWADRAETAAPTPAPVAAPQVVIVVHHSNGTSTAAVPSSSGVAPAGTPVVPVAGAPIPLVAQPTVRVAATAQPANASTHGSR